MIICLKVLHRQRKRQQNGLWSNKQELKTRARNYHNYINAWPIMQETCYLSTFTSFHCMRLISNSWNHDLRQADRFTRSRHFCNLDFLLIFWGQENYNRQINIYVRELLRYIFPTSRISGGKRNEFSELSSTHTFIVIIILMGQFANCASFFGNDKEL